jgi:hypothetical protein
MGGPVRCLHIDLECLVKGHRLPYRAHINVSGEGSLIDETVDDLIIEWRHDESSLLAYQAWNQMTAAEDRALNQTLIDAVLSAYLVKRVRGESIDEYDDESQRSGRYTFTA